MYRITLAVLLSTAVGCSASRSATGGLAAREGHGAVTGYITLAEGVATPDGASACDGLTVKVAPTSTPEDSLGEAQVKLSRGRCLYHLANLPSDGQQLRLSVEPSAAWRCPSGATPTLGADAEVLQLQDYQTVTRDFRATCPSAEATPATP